ncbi:MAG: roadblock/LC7 domain-containing protein [Candidatus Accumulibacter sp.]|jgi:predicted regulator of Ras-like GTPase activity (Roadblock/LC7/MglB family)|nr:roadblock/LC7 domain-containing protein [Accumulibacter sp.]
MNTVVLSDPSPEPSPQLIGDDLRAKAASVLERFVDQFGGVGVRGAVISTADGFDIAMTAMPEAEGTKLSALSSSISAIGDMATLEVGIGNNHQSITIEGGDGYIFILNIPSAACPMILSVAASKEIMLGKLMYYARLVVEGMAEA